VKTGAEVSACTERTRAIVENERNRQDAEKCAIRERRARAIVGVRRGRAGGAFGTAPNVCGGMLKANAP
jgi:uncharacterized membrane protein